MYGGTATNCVFTGNHADGSYGFGGGMYNGTAINCVFTGNYATNRGGGMYGNTAANCVFTGNYAGYDGGGMCNGTAINCVFTGNHVDSTNTFDYGGGGMYNGTATNCVFTGNSAYYGGGMTYTVATNCIITGNSASIEGGGMYGGTATKCIITGNHAKGTYGYGGGMFGGAATNCTITGNSAYYGGGMFVGAATNCVLFGNNALYYGGGAYGSHLYFCAVANNSAAQSSGAYLSNNRVTNCIIWGNTATTQGAPELSLNDTPDLPASVVAYSDVRGGFSGTGNINADPLFVNQSTGNLHLTAGSPCINTATAVAPGGFTFPATDLDGGNRTIGPAPDMGAYETGNPGASGSIAFEGIAANAPAQNVTFQFRSVSGGAAINQTYYTTSDGAFYLYGVPDGSYNLWIKSPTYLAKVVPVTISGGAVSGITATLQPGDANNDNSCDPTDFGLFVSAYNTDASVPGSGYDATCDFNCDGSVDATDFGLLVGSYNTQGAP